MRNALKTLTEICRESVRDALFSNPDDSSNLIAGQLADELDSEVFQDLARHLVTAFFLRLVRAERASTRKAERAQLLLPGFEQLPPVIHLKRKTVALGAASTDQVRQFVRYLVKRHRDRQKADPVLNQARALLALMEAHGGRKDRITVDEVLRDIDGPTAAE